MEHNELDRILRDKLNGLQRERPANAWELFEYHLDTRDSGMPQPEDTIIDQIVFDKLHNYQPARSNTGWHLLRYKMEVRTATFLRIISYKTAEAVALSLLVLLLLKWSGIGEYQPPQSIEPVIAQKDIAAPRIDPVIPKAAQKTPQFGPTLPLPTPPTAGQDKAQPQPNPVGFQVEALPVRTQRVATTNSRAPKPLPPNTVRIPVDGPTKPFGPVRELSLRTDSVSNPAQEREDLFPIPGKIRHFLTVGMFASPTYNRVITPPDHTNDIYGYDRYTLGYGGGISLALDFGSFEFGGGLAYSAIRYDPIPLLVTRGVFNQGYTTEKFDFVELNVLTAPIYARYNVLWNDHWRIYGMAGASLKVAYETNFYGVFPSDLQLPEGLRPTPRRESSFGNRYGWFEGGSFRDNSFVTLDLGMGVERYFSERWSMFVQPTYMHNLGIFTGGMGPTHDRIHSLSILTGVRVRVNH